MVHTVLELAYLVQASIPGSSQYPDTVQALAALARDATRARDLARAADMLGSMAELPRHAACRTDDPSLLDALKRGLFDLAAETRIKAGHTMHPALAIASVYDRVRASGIELPHGAMASIVGSMARVLPSEPLLAVLEALRADFLAQPRGDTSAVCAFLVAYGRAGHPERGEALLAAYAGRGPTCRQLALQHKHAAPHAATYLIKSRARRSGRVPLDVPLGAWCTHAAVWNSLIRARTAAGDLAAAHLWLERYRLLVHVDVDNRPARTASPYLTLMHACSSAQGIRALFVQSSGTMRRMLRRMAYAAEAPYRTAAVHAVLRMVHADKVVPGVAMLNFLTSFEAGRGRVASAAAFARQALALPHAPKRFRVHSTTYAALFMLYGAAAAGSAAPVEVAPLGDGTGAEAGAAPLLARLQTPRALLRSCLACVDALDAPVRARFVARHGTALLNSALAALLACRDYPAALVALRALRAHGVAPDVYTHACVWESIPLHGGLDEALGRAVEAQAGALRAAPGLPAWADALARSTSTGAALVAEAAGHETLRGHYERV